MELNPNKHHRLVVQFLSRKNKTSSSKSAPKVVVNDEWCFLSQGVLGYSDSMILKPKQVWKQVHISIQGV